MDSTAKKLDREPMNKRAIADAFGRAAESYDRHAELQRQVGHQLLDLMPEDLTGLTVLDLGCGTGYFSQLLKNRGAEVYCLDLSSEMLAEAERRCGSIGMRYQVGDAEQLPLADASVDMVFSSLALQWCEDLSVPLAEASRVTKANGKIFFTTLLSESLYELRQAWREIDSYQHVNDFVSTNQVKIALAQAECDRHHLDLATSTLWYPSAMALMRDLKGIGATHVSGRANGLTAPGTIRRLEKAYQKFRNHQHLLPASYQVCFGVIDL
ncbi:malonyl-ACP O-methyltransferase BioC [Vibrio sp.]|uniref:malonyl-ACP O-methyltransferase BioC n=1 Tax=Vibrio sp. TaxID=678 RepID=UPI003D0F8D1C